MKRFGKNDTDTEIVHEDIYFCAYYKASTGIS